MTHRKFVVEDVCSRATKSRFALLALLAISALLTVGAATSAAATLGVTTGGADTGDCEGSPCLTIQYAIGQADPGDTINVGAGTYVQDVNINKAVNLRGAQAGVDARNRTGPETIVQSSTPLSSRSAPFNPNAAGITIDGFTITQQPSRIAGGVGILFPLAASTENLIVTNNLITDNQYGMAAFGDGNGTNVGGMQVTRNYFLANNADGDGAVTTSAMFMPQRLGDDVTISNNAYEDTAAPGGDGAAVNIGGTAADRMDGLNVSNNTSDNDYTFLVHNYGTDATASSNEIANETGSSVFIGGSTDGVLIAGNTITDGAGSGIRVTDLFGDASPVNVTITGNDVRNMGINALFLQKTATAGDMHDITVTDNEFTDSVAGIRTDGDPTLNGLAIEGNRITGNDTGIVSGQSGSLVAENNWWGCNAGPGSAGCDTTTGTVDSSPNLQLSVSSDPATVGLNGTAAVTATFNRNSAGQTVSAPVMDGTSIDFSATGGSVNPATAVVSGGNAATTFTAGSTPGPASVTAALGATSVTRDFTLDPVAATVSAPSLAGSGRVGQVLTCTPGVVTGGNPTPTVETVLLRDGAAIPGQSGLSYTPVAGDIGKSITCRTTATNSAGSPSESSPGVAVTGIPPTLSAPGLAGSGQVGDELTCTPGVVTGGIPAPTVETVLLRDGVAIPGRRGLSYTPVPPDVGKTITCRSTASNPAGSANASSPGITVTAVPDPPKPPVVTPIKQNVTVPANGKVAVTTIKCPDGTCQVDAPKTIKVKIGGKTYTAKVKVQKNVGEGESAKVTIVLPKKAQKALKGKSGKAKLKITVTSSDGKKRNLNQTIKLKGKKR